MDSSRFASDSWGAGPGHFPPLPPPPPPTLHRRRDVVVTSRVSLPLHPSTSATCPHQGLPEAGTVLLPRGQQPLRHRTSSAILHPPSTCPLPRAGLGEGVSPRQLPLVSPASGSRCRATCRCKVRFKDPNSPPRSRLHCCEFSHSPTMPSSMRASPLAGTPDWHLLNSPACGPRLTLHLS